MNTYMCWDESNTDEESAEPYEAHSAESAAEMFASEELDNSAGECGNKIEVLRLNPYKDAYAKRPDGALELFLFGVRYYAGMLESGDNWGHSLGHIEECCKEFQAAIDARAGRAKPESTQSEAWAWNTLEAWSRRPSILDSVVEVTMPFESETRWLVTLTSGTVFCSAHYGETRGLALSAAARWATVQTRPGPVHVSVCSTDDGWTDPPGTPDYTSGIAEPPQPSTRELVATVRIGIGNMQHAAWSKANAALTELEKRIGEKP